MSLRALSAAIALTLASTPSQAESEGQTESETAPQLELVDYFGNTKQALVYDQVEAEYVLVRAGSRLRQFKVGKIRTTEIELFRASNTRVRFVIAKQPPNASAASSTLLDPYATAATNPSPPPVVEAPPAKVNRVRAPATSRAISKPGRSIVSSVELSAALDDLDSLSREVNLELTSGGTRVAAIGKGTLPYRLGLRKGDVVRSVAGIKTRRLEDGADVYVKLSSVKKFTIELVRDQAPVTIHVVVQDR